MAWPRRIARLLRHRWQGDAHRVISRSVLDRLAQRVSASEERHGAQLRLFVEGGLPASYVMRDAGPRERAVAMFGKLRVWDTEHNNGVLIYLLLAEHAIEIVADRGLASRVSEAQWQRVIESMRGALRERDFEDGLNRAIDAVTALLVAHFPLAAGDANPNELPDEPLLG